MKLSPEGYTLVPYASKVVALVEEGIAALNNEGVLRILVQRSVTTTIDPLRSHIATAQTVLTIADSAEEIIAAVSTGEADVGIGDFVESPPGSSPGSPPVDGDVPVAETNGSEPAQEPGVPSTGGATLPPEELVVETLFTDPVVWAASPRHPFASRRSISLEEINGINVGVSAAPEGIRVSPRSMIASQLASGELVELPVNRTGWVIPISIAYRALERDRPGVLGLRNALVEAHDLQVADISHPPFTEVQN